MDKKIIEKINNLYEKYKVQIRVYETGQNLDVFYKTQKGKFQRFNGDLYELEEHLKTQVIK